MITKEIDWVLLDSTKRKIFRNKTFSFTQYYHPTRSNLLDSIYGSLNRMHDSKKLECKKLLKIFKDLKIVKEIRYFPDSDHRGNVNWRTSFSEFQESKFNLQKFVLNSLFDLYFPDSFIDYTSNENISQLAEKQMFSLIFLCKCNSKSIPEQLKSFVSVNKLKTKIHYKFGEMIYNIFFPKELLPLVNILFYPIKNCVISNNCMLKQLIDYKELQKNLIKLNLL